MCSSMSSSLFRSTTILSNPISHTSSSSSSSFPPPSSSSFSFLNPSPKSTTTKTLVIRAIDAAQPYDYESKITHRFQKRTKLKIAIIGFGNFGQFLAKTLIRQGHTVLATSRTDYRHVARDLGVSFFYDSNDLFEEHPEVILLSSSITSTESVLRSLPFQRLKRNTLFVDVLSVKEFPKKLFLSILPEDFDVLCTHPMFGPQSGKNSWKDLKFVYEKVRIRNEESRTNRCERFLDIFAKEGCEMVEMSCEEHDRYAADSQFITHTMGRILDSLRLESTPVDTQGYKTLLNLVENTCGDSFELYNGLFMYNKNSMEVLARLDTAFESLKQQLFGNLHNVFRKQLFENAQVVVSDEKNAVADAELLSDDSESGRPLL